MGSRVKVASGFRVESLGVLFLSGGSNDARPFPV